MKRLVFITIGVLIIVPLVTVGCIERGDVGPALEGGEEMAGSCVTCHTDKDLLKQTATVLEEVKSEETSGEG